jgi:hypothetical protein
VSRGLNLARRPFLNRRPVLRVAVLLALAAAGLLCLNVWLYWQHFAGREDQRTELDQLREKTAEESATLEEALTALESFDVDWQQDQIAFLNARIAERMFSWSALFDHLAEVLPRTVRIERVTPALAGRQSRRRRGNLRSAEDEVALEITGAAEEDEALLELVDAFFAHSRFRRPSLKVEAREGGSSQVGYSMAVIYMPTLPAAEETAPQDSGGETPGEGGPDAQPSPEEEPKTVDEPSVDGASAGAEVAS